jgi:rhodanese-related sulfurtransferase
MCGHGERAATAASLLEGAGHRDLVVVVGGARDWADAGGRTLVTGPRADPVPDSAPAREEAR